jgi:hypothetical protein
LTRPGAQAATREVITPPLGGRTICYVTNTRDEPVDVTIELVDSSSQVFSSVDRTLGPL